MEKKDAFKEIIKGEKPVLVDFYATWCGPCKTMSPILQDFAKQMGDRVRVLKIDVDKNQAVSAQYNIKSIPTLLIFKNGEIKWRQTGVVQKNVLEQMINNLK